MGATMACVALLAAAAAFGAAAATNIGMSEPEQVATDFQFTEGPVWHPLGFLIFSDIPADTIYSLEDGETDVLRRPSGHSNGLTFDPAGRLIACEHGNRRVSITEKQGDILPLATQYQGKRLNSPNDVVVRSDGMIYFTDPPYGVRPEEREIDFQGVYRIEPDGELALLVDDFNKPNGLAFSPDESVLYIADTDEHLLRAFDVEEDGSLAGDRVFYRVEPPGELRPDGLKVDAYGNVYIAASDGVQIVSPEGELLEKIELPERPANLAFGGPDGRTLYVTARSSVYAVAVRYQGAVYRRRFEPLSP